MMQFKRNEGFRYKFDEPLNARFKVLVNGQVNNQDATILQCEIHDISPRGIKMFSKEDFGEHNNMILQLEVNFTLDEVAITAVGDIVWKRPYARGNMYGLMFTNQPRLEQIVISELKARRRKEIQNKQSR